MPPSSRANFEARLAQVGGRLSADAAERRANVEAEATRAAAGGSLSADAAEHRSTVKLTVEQSKSHTALNIAE